QTDVGGYFDKKNRQKIKQKSKIINTMKIFFKFYFLLFTSISFSQNVIYSEKIIMPDKTVFSVTKEEFAELEDYKKDLLLGDYANEQEMLEDYKKILTHKREVAKLENTVEKKKIILSTAEAEKQKAEAEAENKSLLSDIDKINEQYKNFFEGQIGRKITTKEEFEKYYREIITFNEKSDIDVKILEDLKKSKEKTKIFTKLEKQKLLNLKIKYTNMKKSDLNYINIYNANILKEIINLSK
ncbi:hypothetical protein, partial [Flavobacterium branchiophilum]|uniref:hypothetical protein n=1 Tax=Flavobacterium branchiophilum TaxID=55197 RepID=UPI0016806489